MASLRWVTKLSTHPFLYAAIEPRTMATRPLARPAASATTTLYRAEKVNIDTTSRPRESVPSQCSPEGPEGWTTWVSYPMKGS